MNPKEGIVYQVWPRSFFDSNGDGIGDINGVRLKLNYIRELGADYIWLSPVYPSPNRDYGYDVSDYRAINPEFGTMEDFEMLVSDARERNMGILMDFVPNHTSSEHEWFKKALADPSSPCRDYYYFRKGKDGGAPNNWMSFFGGSAWTKDEASGEYYLTSFTPSQCDLNWDNPALRQEMYAAMRFWMDKGVAGFRIDVVNGVKKAEGLPDANPGRKGLQFPGRLTVGQPGAHDYIKEMNAEVFSRYDNCFSVGEGSLATMDDVAEFTRPENRELMMMFHFDIASLGCGPLGKYDFRKLYRFSTLELKRAVESWQVAMQERGGWVGNYLSNHDQPRQINHFGSPEEKYRRASARALGMLNLSLRGTPFIYQGEEVGMTDINPSRGEWKDYEAINAFAQLRSMFHLPKGTAERIVSRVTRDNARTPVQWNGSRNAGFTTGTPWFRVNPNYREVNIEDDVLNMNSVVNFYKRMIALRKEHPVFTWGSFASIESENPSIIAFTRGEKGKDGEVFLVAVNLTGRASAIKLPPSAGAQCALYTHSSRPLEERMRLQPYEGLIYRL